MKYLYIAMGGALGAVFRVLLSKILPESIGKIPLKILIVNVLGCFLIGTMVQLFLLFKQPHIHLQNFLIQGVLASFTTFSTFTLEATLTYKKGYPFSSLTYILLSVVLSILFFTLGLKMMRLWR